jgi:DNA-binding response OmpR family regulator
MKLTCEDLPDSKEVSEADLQRVFAEEAFGRNPPAMGLRVLLVEDDSNAAASLARLLQVDGHQVRVAGTGPAACRAAQDEEPDVVLLGAGGWEVIKQIQERATKKKPFCIALTGQGPEANHPRIEDIGIDLVLVKPVNPGWLRRLLKRFHRVIRPGIPMPGADRVGRTLSTEVS